MAENGEAEAKGGLSDALLDQLNAYLNRATPDGALTCPVTGERVPFTEWNAPDGVVVLPLEAGQGGYQALPLTSPAGGVVLLSMVRVTEAQKAADHEQAAEGSAR